MDLTKTNLRGRTDSDSLAGGERFEVHVCRWKAALATVFFAAFTVFEAIVIGRMDCWRVLPLMTLVTFALTLGFGLSMTAVMGSVWLRRRPFYIIDDRGITDNGIFLGGFGLILWQNIERVTKYSAHGTSLLLRVNNFHELLSRRNFLIKPMVYSYGLLCNLLGGQLVLPITYTRSDAPTVSQQIVHYSNRPQLLR